MLSAFGLFKSFVSPSYHLCRFSMIVGIAIRGLVFIHPFRYFRMSSILYKPFSRLDMNFAASIAPSANMF